MTELTIAPITVGWWGRAVRVALGVIAGLVAAVGVLAVTAAGFALSFDAIKSMAVVARINPDLAWLLPVSIDGAMAVATVAVVVMRGLGRSPSYPWFVVISGAAISVACNAGHALTNSGGVASAAISSIPSVMLAFSVHLVVVLGQATVERLRHSDAPAPAPVEHEPTQVLQEVEQPLAQVVQMPHAAEQEVEHVAPTLEQVRRETLHLVPKLAQELALPADQANHAPGSVEQPDDRLMEAVELVRSREMSMRQAENHTGIDRRRISAALKALQPV